ncbi:MAG: ATP-grasp domain-containing protein [Nitriliruptorales bacterium]|nr:ATP-grasp domain-containing protein [Nitriliruptorales bacterium]
MPRVLLLLPSASYRAEDFVAAAGRLGIELVVAAEYRQALSAVMGDRALRVDLRDPQAAVTSIVAHAGQVALDGIVAADDQGVQVAALAAERLGLPHNSPEAVAATRDKALFRRRLDGSPVRQPAFRVAHAGADVAALVADIGPPCVLKPVSLSGSRGVIRVDDPSDAPGVAERIRRILEDAGLDRNEPLLVESFVAGPEVAVEALLSDGRLEVLAVFDKPDPLEGPYFEETIYTTPSRLPRGVLDRAEEAVAATAGQLGLRHGPVHAELRMTNAGPVMLELAARSIGGLCSRALRFGAGISLEEVILLHAAGLPIAGLRRDLQASGVMMLPIERAGRLVAVEGVAQARDVPGVVGVEITIPAGRQVVRLPEGDRYLGFVFATAATPHDVEQALRDGHARLRVVIDADASTA